MSGIRPVFNPFTFLFLLMIAGGCDLGFDGNQNTITQEDIEAATQIVGESLSDENEGIIGSIGDAITSISANGFVRTSTIKQKSSGHDDNTGRGEETNINHSYDPATGVHRFSFQRIIMLTDYEKNVTDTTRYIYRDPSGNFIQFPDQKRSRIESIRFTDNRRGTINTTGRNSFFIRRDTFQISGLSSISGKASIEGVHHSEGLFERMNSTNGQQFERNYSLEVNFLDIRLDNAFFDQLRNIEQGVTGALTYELRIKDAENASDERIIRGSIDMVGDGTAFLRLDQQQSRFQVNLDNGNVRDASEEFEGQIVTVDPANNMFMLANGIPVKMTSDTRVEPGGDLFTLEAVADTLQSNAFVRAEGDGFIQGGDFNASSVEFEVDDDIDDENDDIDFNTTVESVDLSTQSFELAGGRVITIDNQSVIDDGGDFLSLEEVQNALQQGDAVVADGDARYVEDDNVNFIAEEVEFEIKDDSEEEDDAEKFNFEDIVQSVVVADQTFTLKNGAVVKVTSDTEIRGDFQSLEAIDEALNQGQKVEADGVAEEAVNSNGVNFIARKVDFERIED